MRSAMWAMAAVASMVGLTACGGGGSDPIGVSFTADPMEIGEGDQSTLMLDVTDPDGVDDVERVIVNDLNSGQALLDLEQSPDPAGLYNLIVTWDDFTALETIEFETQDVRPLEAIFVDSKGNESEPLEFEGDFTLICRRQGGTAVNSKCYNPIVDSARADSNCDAVCDERNLTCDADAVVDVFGQVGDVQFQIDDGGNILDITLVMQDCATTASTQPFPTSQGDSTITPDSVVRWACNCIR